MDKLEFVNREKKKPLEVFSIFDLQENPSNAQTDRTIDQVSNVDNWNASS